MPSFTIEEEEYKKNKSMNPLTKVFVLLASFAGIIIVLFGISVYLAKSKNQWKSFTWFMNGDQKFTIKALILGMMSSVVFGFVDNSGLWFGMDALNPYLPSGELTKAGWGNMFSNVMGTFIGTIFSKIIYIMYKFDKGPLYAEVIGVVIGCLLGIYIPRVITGKE